VDTLNLNIIGLFQIPGLGRKRIKKIFECVQNKELSTFNECYEIGIHLKFIKPDQNKAIIQKGKENADKIMCDCLKHQIEIISCFDPAFPASMRIKDQPILLFYKGNINLLNKNQCVSVIGSRKPSLKGYDFAKTIGYFLGENKDVVISGLAKGCDTAGHLGCLNAKGETIAFLPSGFNQIYPLENLNLAKRILKENGCLISEYPPDEKIKPYQFIDRDRLVAAGCNAVIASEFYSKSGTIATLKFASEYQKKIMMSSEIVEISQRGVQELRDQKIKCDILSTKDLKQWIITH
jgi:DNA processing protein